MLTKELIETMQIADHRESISYVYLNCVVDYTSLFIKD